MISFILGISITLNLVFIIALFIILKLFVVKSEKKDSAKDFNNDEIVDIQQVRDFWS